MVWGICSRCVRATISANPFPIVFCFQQKLNEVCGRQTAGSSLTWKQSTQRSHSDYFAALSDKCSSFISVTTGRPCDHLTTYLQNNQTSRQDKLYPSPEKAPSLTLNLICMFFWRMFVDVWLIFFYYYKNSKASHVWTVNVILLFNVVFFGSRIYCYWVCGQNIESIFFV